MTFLATRGCASDFLKMLPKFKMATRGQLKKICGRKNSKKLQPVRPSMCATSLTIKALMQGMSLIYARRYTNI